MNQPPSGQGSSESTQANDAITREIEQRRYQASVPMTSYIPSHHMMLDPLDNIQEEEKISNETRSIVALTELTAYNANPKRIFINLRSQDGEPQSPNITSNFRINLRNVFNTRPGYVWAARVTHVALPYSFYQVTANYNNTLKINNLTAATSVLVFVEPGNYSPSLLTAELSTKISASIGATCTVGFEPITLKLTFTLTAGPPNIFEFAFADPQTNCQFIIGQHENFTLIPGGPGRRMDYVADLVPIDTIYIRSDLVNNNSYGTARDGISNQLAHIVVPTYDAVAVPMLDDNATEFVEHVVDQPTIASFTIQLVDPFENEINLNGLDWNMTIMFTEYYDASTENMRSNLLEQIDSQRKRQLADNLNKGV